MGAMQKTTHLYHTMSGAGSGPPLLVMHGGLGLDHSYLKPHLDRLSDLLPILYYDMRKNGRSARPGDAAWPGRPEEPLRHEDLVADAEALREELGLERWFLFGHSYGSLVALEYAVRHSDRLLGLVLCQATPVLDYPQQMMGAWQARATAAQFEAVQRLILDPPATDEELRQLWLTVLPLYLHQPPPAELVQALGQVRYSAAAYQDAARHCLPHYNVLPRLQEVTAPTLVLCGAHDAVMPLQEGAQRLCQHLPQAELHVFPHSAHFAFAEEPEAFQELLRGWLGQRLAAGC